MHALGIIELHLYPLIFSCFVLFITFYPSQYPFPPYPVPIESKKMFTGVFQWSIIVVWQSIVLSSYDKLDVTLICRVIQNGVRRKFLWCFGPFSQCLDFIVVVITIVSSTAKNIFRFQDVLQEVLLLCVLSLCEFLRCILSYHVLFVRVLSLSLHARGLLSLCLLIPCISCVLFAFFVLYSVLCHCNFFIFFFIIVYIVLLPCGLCMFILAHCLFFMYVLSNCVFCTTIGRIASVGN